MRLIPIASVVLCLLAAAPAQAAPDLAEIARIATSGAATAEAKVRAAVDWTHAELQWTATDYKARSVEEVLARGGGNCNEQARVVAALLERTGVKVRFVREINIQPANDHRQAQAAALVAEQGPAASVFGRRHNDHVWIEYWDSEAGGWAPADPTLKLVGYEAWIKARLGFGGRPQHDIVPSRDMLAPIAVFAVAGRTPVENRSTWYLIDGFAAHVPGVRDAAAWADWTARVRAFEGAAGAAFRGEADLHAREADIAALQAAYEALRVQTGG